MRGSHVRISVRGRLGAQQLQSPLFTSSLVMPSLREDHFSILVCPPIKDLKDASDIVYEIEEYFDGNYGPVKYSDTDFYFSFLDEPNPQDLLDFANSELRATTVKINSLVAMNMGTKYSKQIGMHH